MQLRLPHRRKLMLFVVLSAIDLFLTWRLLDRPDTLIYEINPLARWSWEQVGWFGLIGFKTALVGIAAAASLMIARRRPHTAGRVLTFGCAAAALVVGYSLFVDRTATRMPDVQLLQAEQARFQQQDEDLRKRNDYRAVLDRVVAEVIEERCTLVQAVDQLLDTERGHDPVWLSDFAAKQPNLSPEACLALQIVRMAVASRPNNSEAARAMALRLENEMRVHFGSQACARLEFYLPPKTLPRQFILQFSGEIEVTFTISFQPET